MHVRAQYNDKSLSKYTKSQDFEANLHQNEGDWDKDAYGTTAFIPKKIKEKNSLVENFICSTLVH